MGMVGVPSTLTFVGVSCVFVFYRVQLRMWHPITSFEESEGTRNSPP